jgi:hypothetical protein
VGDNHFIVDGVKPDAGQARELARQWSIIRIGNTQPEIEGWTIRTKAFREDLEWAIVIEDYGTRHSPAVVQLLDELAARGIVVVRDSFRDSFNRCPRHVPTQRSGTA